MDTTEYIEYTKYGVVGGAAMFILGAVGQLGGSLVTELPAQAETAFLYMLVVGLFTVFFSIIAAGILPLAFE